MAKSCIWTASKRSNDFHIWRQAVQIPPILPPVIRKLETTMSTDFRTMQTIRFVDLFDGRLGKLGTIEKTTYQTCSGVRCLTDGSNCIWAFRTDHGNLDFLSRYGQNSAENILWAIGQIFDTGIVSEHEPQYWGFDTQEDMDRYMEQTSERMEAKKFHPEFINYVLGRPYDTELVCVEEAVIANDLVAKEPRLSFPENAIELLERVREKRDSEQY